jgi:hypothetical protein
MQWIIPKTDVGISRWLELMEPELLDCFILEAEYLLDGGDGDGHLGTAVVLGAARRWRDERTPPIVTIRETAPADFYEAEAA